MLLDTSRTDETTDVAMKPIRDDLAKVRLAASKGAVQSCSFGCMRTTTTLAEEESPMPDNRQKQSNQVHRCEFCGKELVNVRKRNRFCSISHSKRKHSDQTIERAKLLWIRGATAPEIAKRLGCTPDVIYGISMMNDFPSRLSHWTDSYEKALACN